jgi:hypothetical protein
LKLKYNSIQVAIATIRIRLRIFPIPKYDSRRKKVRAMVATIPRLLFAKIREKVKRRQKKIRTKKRKIAPKEPGSTK